MNIPIPFLLPYSVLWRYILKKDRFLKFSLIVAGLLFFVTLLLLGYRLFQYHQGRRIYDSAIEIVKLPPLDQPSILDPVSSSDTTPAADSGRSDESPACVEALSSMDITALQAINTDVLGWITIPDTILSYPLVQGSDNSYYLDHTWDHQNNIVGSIYLESSCSSDFSDFNTLIFGHRMNNLSMFGSLKAYKDLGYWTQHPDVLITDQSQTRTYRIFAAMEAEITDPVYLVKVTATDEKQSVIDSILAKNILNTGIVPTTDDQIITLCTCTGRGYESRFVVLAVLQN